MLHDLRGARTPLDGTQTSSSQLHPLASACRPHELVRSSRSLARARPLKPLISASMSAPSTQSRSTPSAPAMRPGLPVRSRRSFRELVSSIHSFREPVRSYLDLLVRSRRTYLSAPDAHSANVQLHLPDLHALDRHNETSDSGHGQCLDAGAGPWAPHTHRNCLRVTGLPPV